MLRRWLRESMAGSFVYWRRATTVFLGEDLHGSALRLLERTVARIGRRHVGFAFASWVRVMKREERRLAALRAFDRSLRSWSRSSVAASFVFWARIIRDMRRADEAKDRAASAHAAGEGRQQAERQSGELHAPLSVVAAPKKINS